MGKRKARQKSEYLGHRSHGRGNCKNRRGSGNRGGRGMAGIDKHKWSWVTRYEPDYYGKVGFCRPVSVDVPVVHLFELNQKALLNKLEKKGNKHVFSFRGKVLATGSVTIPLEIKAYAWSKSVEAKLKAAGGEISKLEGGPKPAPQKAASPAKAK